MVIISFLTGYCLFSYVAAGLIANKRVGGQEAKVMFGDVMVGILWPLWISLACFKALYLFACWLPNAFVRLYKWSVVSGSTVKTSLLAAISMSLGLESEKKDDVREHGAYRTCARVELLEVDNDYDYIDRPLLIPTEVNWDWDYSYGDCEDDEDGFYDEKFQNMLDESPAIKMAKFRDVMNDDG